MLSPSGDSISLAKIIWNSSIPYKIHINGLGLKQYLKGSYSVCHFYAYE